MKNARTRPVLVRLPEVAFLDLPRRAVAVPDKTCSDELLVP
jgi:hypothetical protein